MNEIMTALEKRAKGYTYSEINEEWDTKEGDCVLIKRKVSKKHMPPDISAIKILLDMPQDDLDESELVAAREKLLCELAKISAATINVNKQRQQKHGKNGEYNDKANCAKPDGNDRTNRAQPDGTTLQTMKPIVQNPAMTKQIAQNPTAKTIMLKSPAQKHDQTPLKKEITINVK